MAPEGAPWAGEEPRTAPGWVEAVLEWDQVGSFDGDWSSFCPQRGLEIAIERDHPLGVKRALALGADPLMATSGGETCAMALAIVSRAREAALALAPGCELGKPDRRGRPPLLAALALGMVDVARELVALGADPRAVSSRGDTAAHAACRGEALGKERSAGGWGSAMERLACVELASTLGVDWERLNHDQHSPIELLAMRGAPLAEWAWAAPKGAPLNASDAGAALAYAILANRFETVRWMLRDGRFGFGACDDERRDALMLAAKDGRASMVRLLLGELGPQARREHGRERKDRHGFDALDCAARSRQWLCVAALVEGGWLAMDADRGSSRARVAASKGDVMALKEFAKGMDLRAVRGEDGERLLALAARSGSDDVVRWLVEFDPDSVDALDDRGLSALDQAALVRSAIGVEAILSALPPLRRASAARAAAFFALENGGEGEEQTSWLEALAKHFDLDQPREGSGETLLMVAAKKSASAAARFLASRVDTDAVDAHGRSALWLACSQSFDRRSHDGALQALIPHGGHGAIFDGTGETPLMRFVSCCADSSSLEAALPELVAKGDPSAKARCGSDARQMLARQSNARRHLQTFDQAAARGRLA